MVLKSTRLHLRSISISDVEKVHELYTIPEVNAFDTDEMPTNSMVTQVLVEEWIEGMHYRKEYVYVIECNQEHHCIGLIAIRLGTPKYKLAVVWYKVFPLFWRKGYATEALQKILAFGFDDLDLHRIEASCAIENIGSYRVLERVGMKREGQKKKVYPLAIGWSDSFEYGILKEEWDKS